MSTFFSPAALLEHFQIYLPRLTDKFSENAVVSGEILAGDPQILKVTDSLHGQSAGSEVTLIDGKIDNNIISVTSFSDPAGDGLRFTTGEPHDLTYNYTPEIELAGFTDTGLNGTFALLNVPSRTTFEITYPTLPTLNGNEVLREEWEIGINGLFIIDRVPDVNTYEIDLVGKPLFTVGPVPILKRASQLRMSVAIDAERVQASYTKQSDPDKLWLYIIMGDSAASKDRTTKTDASQTNTAQNPGRVLMINTFTTLIVFPTQDQSLGGNASEAAWNEILKLMLAIGAGIDFDDFGNFSSRSTMIDHGSSVYTNAFYSHAYTFEYNYEVTLEESFLYQFITSRAFRDNKISLTEISEGSELDLDEEPT